MGGLVLSQINIPGSVESPWEIISFLRSELGGEGRRVEKKEGKLCLCKMNKIKIEK